VTDHLGIPIDENFEFDICTPPQPGAGTVLTTWVESRPDNTVTDSMFAPVLNPVPVGDQSLDPCANDQFGPVKVHVTIPLSRQRC
jgi:hypothetical protein